MEPAAEPKGFGNDRLIVCHSGQRILGSSFQGGKFLQKWKVNVNGMV